MGDDMKRLTKAQKENRWLEILEEECERACRSYNPLKIQSSYLPRSTVYSRMIHEGTITDREAWQLAIDTLERGKRIIRKVGKRNGMHYDKNAMSFYPNKD